MAGLNETPRGNRIHIAFFGLRNAGKSTLVNAFTGQQIAIVSDVPGTTTDPVSKAMEILPLGPCLVTDTAGLYDARLMAQMAQVIGKTDDVRWFQGSAEIARAYIRGKFLEADGLLLKPMRHLQTACVFALHFGVVEGEARTATLELLKKSIREHGDCLQTGFLGTSFLMDALGECGAYDVCYTLLLQHKNPSWLYSVDQGATTIWERWNSYTKDSGFGPVGMNSFNHYAYGQVLGWMYRTIAGIAADPAAPGFRNIIMAPKPDRRLGSVKAEYRSRAGLITSAWRYEGETWIWDFTVPEGATATVTLPNGKQPVKYGAGEHHVELRLN